MKPGHVAISKISSPVLPQVVPRKRLFQKLDRRGHYGLTWISGMAGSGKTTLVASYLARCKTPCLWYNMDEGDEDLATFFYYLGLAARKVTPGKRGPLPLLTPEYLGNVSTFSRRYFETLCARFTEPFFLVFDDYQKIPPSSPFHETFRDGVSMSPPHIHVTVLSRSDPPPHFAAMLANNHMRIVGGKDLRLSLIESRKIAEIASGKRLSGKLIDEIHSKTQGWAAGLILMAKGLRTGQPLSDGPGTSAPEEVFSYFVGELFSGMDVGVRAFLLQIAFLPRMTVSMARTLTGRAEASRILRGLERNHLFTERYPSQGSVYQFHPLFREFLLSRAEETVTAGELRRLRRKAAEVLTAAGYCEEAVDLFAKARETAGLVRLIEQQARGIIEQGRNRTLEQWIRKLPEDILEKNPWMFYWLGVSCQYVSPAEARGYFENAFRLFEEEKDRTGQYLAWSGIVGSTVYEWDYFTVLDRWIDWLERHLTEGHAFPSPEIEARVAVAMMCALLFRRPQHPDMMQWVERALALARHNGDHRLRIEAADWAITYYCWLGDFARADIIKAETGRLIETSSAYPPGMLHWKWLDVSTRMFNGVPDQSMLGEISEALRIIEETHIYTWEHMFLLNGTFIALMLGDLSKAGEFVKRLEPVLGPSRYHGNSVFHHCAALYRLLIGDVGPALEHARIAVEISVETGYVFPEIVCRYGLAQILLEQGNFDKAAEELEVAHSIARKTESGVFEFMYHAGKAWLALNRGIEEAGLPHLKEAMELGRKLGLQNMIWWWHPKMMASLCVTAIKQGIEVDYVKGLIKAHNLTLDNPPYDLDDWPWALIIHSFDRFEILIDDEPLRSSGKGHRRPLELLKALIARGGVEVDIERIMDDLWPEADGDMAHSAFSTNLNRLRKLLAKKEVIQLHDGKLSLNRRYCWIDTWAFEAILKEAGVLWEEGKKQEATARYEKALSIYKGPFLADEPLQHWMVSYRERLALLYLRTHLKLGRGWEKEGLYERATKVYERGLSVDSLEETLYQRLMRCYHRLGRYADAVRVYERCKDTLSQELGVTPSEETDKIFVSITNSMPKTSKE